MKMGESRRIAADLWHPRPSVSVRNPPWHSFIGVVLAALLCGCATEQSAVVDRLDERTGVTVTYSRTPFVFSSGETADSFPQMDLVQVGPIEINRMGALEYYLWLGITEYRLRDLANGRPPEYESIVFNLDGEEMHLDVAGWSHADIGTSEAVYSKLFGTSVDAFYAIDLRQISSLLDADDIRLRTAGQDAVEYTLTFDARRAREDLREFYQSVVE